MRKLIWGLVLAVVFVSGCASMRDMLLPSSSDFDNSRRFWDQTSDNPYR